jgi:2-hydroxy-3-oxopropionate reductase
MLKAKMPLVLEANSKPGIRIELKIKDLNNALETAHSIGAPVPITALVMEILQEPKVDGKAGDDHGGLIRFYEKIAGIQVRKN